MGLVKVRGTFFVCGNGWLFVSEFTPMHKRPSQLHTINLLLWSRL